VEVDWEKLLPPKGFQVLPRRWVVERTFSWIDHNRRMSKDYERLTETSEAFIYVAMSRWLDRESFLTVSYEFFSETGFPAHNVLENSGVKNGSGLLVRQRGSRMRYILVLLSSFSEKSSSRKSLLIAPLIDLLPANA
jgi:hypothetical protein